MNLLKIKVIIINILLLGTISAAISGCSSDKESKTLAELIPMPQQPPITNLTPETLPIPPRYNYPHPTRRNPFAPLIGKASYVASGESGLSKGKLANLELKGILKDQSGKIAVIEASDGEPFIIKSGKIYDRKNRIIWGVSGIIKKSSVVLISKNGSVTELRIRQEADKAGLIVNPQ